MGWCRRTEKNSRYCFNPVSGNLLIPCCEHHRNTLVFLSFVPGANPQFAGPQVRVGVLMTLLYSLQITQITGHTQVPSLICQTGQPGQSWNNNNVMYSLQRDSSKSIQLNIDVIKGILFSMADQLHLHLVSQRDDTGMVFCFMKNRYERL